MSSSSSENVSAYVAYSSEAAREKNSKKVQSWNDSLEEGKWKRWGIRPKPKLQAESKKKKEVSDEGRREKEKFKGEKNK